MAFDVNTQRKKGNFLGVFEGQETAARAEPLGILHEISSPLQAVDLLRKHQKNNGLHISEGISGGDEKARTYSTKRALRRRLYEMLRSSSWLLKDYDGKAKQRVTNCRYAVINRNADIEVVHKGGTSWFEGLQVCASVWSCPVCSNKISEVRRTEANKALSFARENGFNVYMVTMTFSHKLGDDLAELKNAAMSSWKRMQRRRDWRAMKEDIVGTIRALEVTHGANGWHPHLHMIVITKKPMQTALESLSGAWLKSLQTEGLSASEDRGWQVQSASAAGKYIAKFGAAEELTFGQKKRGRGSSSRGVWQILEDYTYSGDIHAGELFQEFAVAFKGTKQLVWSHGLKALVGVDDLDDDQAAEEGELEELRGLISYDTWIGDEHENRPGARRRRIKILEAADVDAETCFSAINANEEDELPQSAQVVEAEPQASQTARAERPPEGSEEDFGRGPRSGRDQKSYYEQGHFVTKLSLISHPPPT